MICKSTTAFRLREAAAGVLLMFAMAMRVRGKCGGVSRLFEWPVLLKHRQNTHRFSG